jgi:hypothetical protein
MKADTARMRIEEQTVLVKGLVDALVELYPEEGAEDDEKFFAVLMQAQRVASELRDHVCTVLN